MAVMIAQSGEASHYTTGVSILLFMAILVLVAHVVLSLAYIAVRYDRHEWLARIFDADSYPSGSLPRALSKAVHLRLMQRIEPHGSVIASPTRVYKLHEHLADGDLCAVHRAISDGRSYVLKAPRMANCNRLLTKEYAMIGELRQQSGDERYREYFPSPVETFPVGGRTISVFHFDDGFFTADQIRQSHPAGLKGRQLAWMFHRTLEALGFVHRCGWLHGAVMPEHLLFHTHNHGLKLIGWTHASRIGKPLEIVSRKYKSWYPPECHRREVATPATDIYLAAKSMIWLAGGNPVTEELPAHLPGEIVGLLRECLSPFPARRYDDAWALHEELGERLEDVYDPARFCQLTMS